MIEDLILGLLPAELAPVATIGDLPGTQKNEICIMLFDGAGNFEYFGDRLESTIYQPIVKAIVRNYSYETGKYWSELVKESLHRYTGSDILSIFLVGSPMYLGRSPQKFHEFQLTFKIKTKE